MSRHVVAVVAFDRISAFHLSVPCVVFGEALPPEHPFELRVCAAESQPIRTTAGIGLTVPFGLEALREAATIIVPSWRNPAEGVPQPLLEALGAAAQRGARIVGLCLGAYVLAEAGLLDGRRATTHWEFAADFASRYPLVHLDADVLYVEDGDILTSAGTAAGIDCCLHLLRQLCGSEFANRVARRLVVPPHRQGGQAQFIEQPLPAPGRDTRLAGLLDWLRGNLAESHNLDELASRAAMSRRSFTRHFRALTGTSLNEWLLAERLGLSQRLLESTGHDIPEIARLSGFRTPESLRHHFRQTLGVSPAAWRRSFQGG